MRKSGPAHLHQSTGRSPRSTLTEGGRRSRVHFRRSHLQGIPGVPPRHRLLMWQHCVIGPIGSPSAASAVSTLDGRPQGSTTEPLFLTQCMVRPCIAKIFGVMGCIRGQKNPVARGHLRARAFGRDPLRKSLDGPFAETFSPRRWAADHRLGLGNGRELEVVQKFV